MAGEKECTYCHSMSSNGCRVDGAYYCNPCYQRVHKYGTPIPKKRKNTNTFTTAGEVLLITTRNGFNYIADADDRELLEKYSWCRSATGYAVANIGHKVTKMHRYIMGITDPNVLVDHKNRNIYDNRKENLRICTHAENCRNKSVSKNCKTGHLGIRQTKEGKYNVRITSNWKEIYIGNYETLEDAIKAREAAEDKYRKEFGSHKA